MRIKIGIVKSVPRSVNLYRLLEGFLVSLMIRLCVDVNQDLAES